MNFSEKNTSYCADEVVSLIEGSQELCNLYGRWPTFADSEIVAINFDRGNLLECIRLKNWTNQIQPSLKCSIYTFDGQYADSDHKRNYAIVDILFEGINELNFDGFNYQNAICGIEISRIFSSDLKIDVFKVSWGGAALQHDVTFTCSSIKIASVQIMK